MSLKQDNFFAKSFVVFQSALTTRATRRSGCYGPGDIRRGGGRQAAGGSGWREPPAALLLQ